MKKPNNFLNKIAREREIALQTRTKFTLQMSLDAALIAAADTFGIGEKRAKQFMDQYAAVYNELATMILDDAKSDREIQYTKAKVDDRLKKICGKYFCPWEERYQL